MHANRTSQAPAPPKKSRPVDRSGTRALTPDDDDADNNAGHAETHIDPLRPWYDEFAGFIGARDSVPQDMTTIEWWGVCDQSSRFF
jgi:hypothetical protein